MEFKQITPEQFDDVKEFFRDVFTKEPWNDDWSDDRQLTMYITELICSANSLAYAMFDGEEMTALSLGHIKHWYSGTEYYIEELCVRTDLQGQGIGTAFIEHIENALRGMGIAHIFLQTGKDMPAYEFYLRRGFTELTGHVSFAKNIQNDKE